MGKSCIAAAALILLLLLVSYRCVTNFSVVDDSYNNNYMPEAGVQSASESSVSTPTLPNQLGWNNFSGITPLGMADGMVAYYPPDDAYILFGGASTGSSAPSNYTWKYVYNSGWENISGGVSPSAREFSSMFYSNATGNIYLFGGYGGVTIANKPVNNTYRIYNDIWEFNSNGWKNISSSYNVAPPPMYGEAYTYITQSGNAELLMVDGYTYNSSKHNGVIEHNYTWIFNPQTGWKNETQSITPPLSADPMLTYDSNNGLAYLYLSNNTLLWAFNPSTDTWSNATSPQVSGLSKRSMSTFFYNKFLNELVLFGGLNIPVNNINATNITVTNETWIYNIASQSWSKLSQSAIPPLYSSIYYSDPFNNVDILFGGKNSSGDLTSSAWIFNGSWSILSNFSVPYGRIYAAHVSTPYGMYIFGGNNNNMYLNDLWVFNYTDELWYNVSTYANPQAREGAMLTYIPQYNTLFLFGGKSSAGFLNDTWLLYLSNTTWYQIDAKKAPEPRSFMAGGYIDNGNIVIFGGLGYNNVVYGDTWLFSIQNDTWWNDSLRHMPQPVYGTAYMVNNYNLIVAGGLSDKNYSSNVWIFNATSSSWQEDNNFSMYESAYSAITYVSVYNEYVGYGGLFNNNPAEDTYVHKAGEGWMNLTLTRNPPPLYSSIILYSVVSNSLFLYSGSTGHSILASMWIMKNIVNGTLPSAPTNLIISKEINGFNASWSAPYRTGGGNILYYDILITDNNKTVELKTVNEYIADNKLLPWLNYTVKISAVNGLGYGSPLSRNISTYGVPGAPVNLTFAYKLNAVLLSWNITENYNIINYTIYYTYNFNIYNISVGISDSYELIKFPYSTDLVVYVTAWNIYGQSRPSNSVTLNTYDTKTPPPVSIHAVSGLYNISLAWNAPQYNGTIAYYTIFYGLTSVPEQEVNTTSTAYIFKDLYVNTEYYFRVVVNTISLSSVLSNEVNGIAYTYPQAPANINSVSYITFILLYWNNSAGTVGTYIIYYGTSASALNLNVTVSGLSSSAVISNLTSGTAYYIRIVAVNPVGSNSSSVFRVSTLARAVSGNQPDLLLYILISAVISVVAIVIASFVIRRKNEENFKRSKKGEP